MNLGTMQASATIYMTSQVCRRRWPSVAQRLRTGARGSRPPHRGHGYRPDHAGESHLRRRSVVHSRVLALFGSPESSLELYLPWIEDKWAGERHGAKLWRRLKRQGFRGCLRVVSECVACRRLAERMDSDALISVETPAVFIRFWLATTPALPEPAARRPGPRRGNAMRSSSPRSVGASRRDRSSFTWLRRTKPLQLRDDDHSANGLHSISRPIGGTDYAENYL